MIEPKKPTKTTKPSTKQEGQKRDAKGRIVPGAKLNPAGKGGFAERPEDRSDGRWSAKDSISYQYKMLMRLTLREMAVWYEANEETMTVAQDIAYQRIKAAKKSLLDAREVTDRTEGKAPQFIGLGNTDEYNKVLVEFIDTEQDK